jgi:GR25 family glycosyltransferase involved in LPS biosynthesis
VEVLYINLKKRPERNERFLQTNLAITTFQRLDAVEGLQVRWEDLLKEGLAQEPLPRYTPGAVGCALSHRKVWDLCIVRGTPVTVAEDDAVFNRYFEERAASVLARLPFNWDIVLWGWNFDSILHVEFIEGVKESVMKFDARNLGLPQPGEPAAQVAAGSRGASVFQQRDYDVLPLRLLGAFGTVCYSVSPSGAARLRDLCFPLRHEIISVPGLGRDLPNYGIDTVMNKHYRSLNSYVSFPPLVWTENDKAISDVGPG